MDFHRYVREHLPALTTRREPEIVDELALHLAELYREATASGLDHAAALAQATAALPKDGPGFARELESASLALPDIIAERWREQDATELPRGGASPLRLLAEDVAGAPSRVVVISHGAWMNRFGGDRAIVGRNASLNGHTYTVIGVTPRGFTGPVLGRVPEMWAPMALQPELRPPSAGVRRSLGGSNLLTVRATRWLNMIGRLSEPSALHRASGSLDTLA